MFTETVQLLNRDGKTPRIELSINCQKQSDDSIFLKLKRVYLDIR